MRCNQLKSLRKFEVLEDRRMMTGDISYNSSNHILTITGAGYDDVAEVRFEGNKVYVDLTAGESGGGTDHRDTNKKITDVSKIVFNGLAGQDRLNVVVNPLSSGVTLNNIALEFHGGDNDDQLTSPLQSGLKTVAFGDGGNDILQGSKFDDTLEGGAGNDDLSGGGGNDTYVFSGSTDLGTDKILSEAANVGTDTLDFNRFGQSANVNLATVYDGSESPFAYGVYTPTLKVKLYDESAIENVLGSLNMDTLNGNSRPNYLYGGGSADVLNGGGGNDTLEGGAGSDVYKFIGGNLGSDSIIEAANVDRDRLDFTRYAEGVTVDLSKAGSLYAVNSANLKLKLSNNTAIEDVSGSQFNDTLYGNSRDNELWGWKGNDTISGGAGTDLLHGGDDDDTLFTDSLDRAFGDFGRDWFDHNREPATLGLSNPNPSRYMDWGNIGLIPEIQN